MDVLAGLVLLVLIVGVVVIGGIVGLAHLTASSDIHQHSGSFTHEHSGTFRHEVAGTVQHTVLHAGTVQHVHQIDPADRMRLDGLAAQRELEAEQARIAEFELLQRKLDALEVRRSAELRRIHPVIEG